MVIVWLVVLVVLGVALFAVLVIGVGLGTGSRQKKAIADAPAILDAAFDGRENVVVKTTWVSLPYEQFVLGAKERGYQLTNQTGTGNDGATLIFEKVA